MTGTPEPPSLCRDWVFLVVGYRSRDRLARPGLYIDAALPDRDREHVHRPRRRPGNDLPVAVVDRAMAGAVEAAGGLDRVLGLVVLPPGHGATQVRALLPEGEEPLRHSRQVELALRDLGHLAHLEVARRPRQDRAAEGAGAPRPEERQEPN